jgi:hypothetical protein
MALLTGRVVMDRRPACIAGDIRAVKKGRSKAASKRNPVIDTLI